MSLLPSEATYAEQVADYFLAFKGAGLTLSALEVELVIDWEQRGVPLAVVCRGIRKAAEAKQRTERPGHAALRSLRACAKAVEAELRQHQGLSVGKSTTRAKPELDPIQARMKRVQATLQKARRLAPPALGQAIERVLPLTEPRSESPTEASARVAYVEEALALCYLRALPFRERLELGQSLKAELRGLLRSKSPKAKRAALRAHRILRARLHGNLPAVP